MSLEKVLGSIEQYLVAKRDLEAASRSTCSDWDCGIADELSDYASTAGARQQLESAKKAFESALASYVDARVDALLKNRIDQ